MTKIMYLLNYIGDGGTEKYVMNLIDAAGRDNCIFVYSSPGPFLEKFHQMNIPMYQVNMRHPFDMQAAWNIRQIARKERVDVIHTQFLRENYLAILAKLLGAKVRVIWTYHVDVPMPFPLKSFNELFTKRNDAIICVSHFMKQQLMKKGAPEKKLHVIYNGIEDPFISSSFSKQKTKSMAVIGRLSKEKGHHFLLQALHALHTSAPSLRWHCNIIGDGPLKQELVEAMHTLSLTGRVTFKGFRDNVIDEYLSNDIIIVPSENESLSYVAIEAAAMQKPVIATRIGGLPEAVKDKETGILVRYGDIEQLTQAIRRLIEEEELCYTFGIRGREYYLEHFTFTKMIEETFQIYRNRGI